MGELVVFTAQPERTRVSEGGEWGWSEAEAPCLNDAVSGVKAEAPAVRVC